MPLSRRKIAAALSGTAIASLVLSLSLGEALVVWGRPEYAMMLPGNAAMTARSALPELSVKLAAPAVTGLSLAALRESPLVQPAVTWLALDAAKNADRTRQARLFRLAARLGWRDEFSQRRLYNAAIGGDAPDAALMHASALLQQNMATQRLFRRLVIATRLPRYRAAIAREFTRRAPWTDRWIMASVRSLPDDVVLEMLRASTASGSMPDRGTVVGLTQSLIAGRRFAAAGAVWRLASGKSASSSGMLDWPAAGNDPPSPFEWHLPEGYAIESGSPDSLVARYSSGAAFVHRLFILPPGQYILGASDAPASLSAWRLSFQCGTKARVGFEQLKARNVLRVPESCPVQWLSLSAPHADATPARLSPLSLYPLVESKAP